jgi:hypothetical protein
LTAYLWEVRRQNGKRFSELPLPASTSPEMRNQFFKELKTVLQIEIPAGRLFLTRKTPPDYAEKTL